MEYRKLNYIKNGVDRDAAIDCAAGREQFSAYAPAFYFRQVHWLISFAAYYRPDYHNTVDCNELHSASIKRAFASSRGGVHAMCSIARGLLSVNYHRSWTIRHRRLIKKINTTRETSQRALCCWYAVRIIFRKTCLSKLLPLRENVRNVI